MLPAIRCCEMVMVQLSTNVLRRFFREGIEFNQFQNCNKIKLKCTCQMTCKSVKRFKQNARMWTTTDRSRWVAIAEITCTRVILSKNWCCCYDNRKKNIQSVLKVLPHHYINLLLRNGLCWSNYNSISLLYEKCVCVQCMCNPHKFFLGTASN